MSFLSEIILIWTYSRPPFHWFSLIFVNWRFPSFDCSSILRKHIPFLNPHPIWKICNFRKWWLIPCTEKHNIFLHSIQPFKNNTIKYIYIYNHLLLFKGKTSWPRFIPPWLNICFRLKYLIFSKPLNIF